MKKILIGVGIGCGALILIGVVVVGAGAYWVKGKAEGVVAAGQKLNQQSKELESLNARYRFSAPKEGEPLKLQKDRLDKYLVIREALMPVYKRFEEKGKALEAKTKANNGQASLGDSMKAAGMLADLTTELRQAYIDGLKQQEMSPQEFQYTTMAIFTAEPGTHTSDLARSEQQGAELSVQTLEAGLKNPNLTAEQRADLQQQLDEAKQNLAEAKKGVAGSAQLTQLHEQNAKLLASYKDRIQNEVNPGLDALLLSGFESSKGAAEHEDSQ